MRTFALISVFSLLAATGCRTTHDADSSELANLNSISMAFADGGTVAGDQGEAAVGQVWTVYPVLQQMSDKDNRQQNAGPGLPMIDRDGMGEASVVGHFLQARRTAWPDCVTEGDNSYTYDACEYGASSNSGSADFLLDGSIAWTDTSYDADILFDLSVNSDNLGVETSFTWVASAQWTDLTYDGEFHFNFGAGVSLNTVSIPLGATKLNVDATIEALTWTDACTEGPVSGIIDWKSVYQRGTDIDRSHVTVEYLGCGSATITW